MVGHPDRWPCRRKLIDLLDSGYEPVAIRADPGVMDVPDFAEVVRGSLRILANQAREFQACNQMVIFPAKTRQANVQRDDLGGLLSRPQGLTFSL